MMKAVFCQSQTIWRRPINLEESDSICYGAQKSSYLIWYDNHYANALCMLDSRRSRSLRPHESSANLLAAAESWIRSKSFSSLIISTFYNQHKLLESKQSISFTFYLTRFPSHKTATDNNKNTSDSLHRDWDNTIHSRRCIFRLTLFFTSLPCSAFSFVVAIAFATAIPLN